MLNEQLSAWCDGEHSDLSERSVSEVAGEQGSACEVTWLIGDILRGDPVLSADFTSRVMTSLETEPVVVAPQAAKRRVLRAYSSQWMPVAAAVSGVVVAAWMASSVWLGSVNRAQFPTSVPVAADQSNAALPIIASRMRVADKAYLMAHQASSVGAPMADVAHYIRTVGDDQQDLGK